MLNYIHMKKPINTNRLTADYFDGSTIQIARGLLGQLLVRRVNGKLLIVKIVETEAYNGPHDLASHASRGITPRTAPMFEAGGHAYIYLIYGMYNCFNITTGASGYPAAVLIRAIEPLEGIEFMKKLRHTNNLKNLCSGPGKLCQALGIDRQLNREDLSQSNKIWLEKPTQTTKFKIKKAPRVGVDYAGPYRDKLWRFYIDGNDFVSKK